jgi:transposase
MPDKLVLDDRREPLPEFDEPRTRIAMEAGTHSIWISEQLQELGHEVVVANVRSCVRSHTVIARATR